ncbi:CDP-alcohol phosphatidyltransferase family protein [Novosphingobium profundi]|uniref:CDP-alcohol phosphatidyltransferase family protein n=1 Tax=Novosphingobium profundi TaxID=1774954 RepID=UPI00299E88D0|nr:CDP-alcohol phosphatidyltransferase family protein [Novosphingobium profundi]
MNAAPIDRIQENVLACAECRLLSRLCAYMPRWVVPDILTAIGMFGAFIVFSAYVLSNLGDSWLWLSIAGYFIHWFGDSMDGSLARYRKIERPRYGYFLDQRDGLENLHTEIIEFSASEQPGRLRDRSRE